MNNGISYVINENGAGLVIKCRDNAVIEALSVYLSVDLNSFSVSLRADHHRVHHDGHYYFQLGDTEYLQYSEVDFLKRRIPELKSYDCQVIDLTHVEQSQH